jgi:hypothetical protein
MSTKIYEGYKIPIRKLNDFIAFTHKYNVKKKAELVDVLMSCEPEFTETPTYEVKNLARWKRHQTFSNVIKKCYDASLQSLRSEYDIECGLNIWIYKDNAYVIPINCDYGKVPKFAEDYSYWNNTDRPETVSAAAWAGRCRVWEKICLHSIQGHNSLRLYHGIVELKNSMYIGAMEIEDILFPDRYK